MTQESINKIIQNYAHDYRDMAMTEIELLDMLSNFYKEANEA